MVLWEPMNKHRTGNMLYVVATDEVGRNNRYNGAQEMLGWVGVWFGWFYGIGLAEYAAEHGLGRLPRHGPWPLRVKFLVQGVGSLVFWSYRSPGSGDAALYLTSFGALVAMYAHTHDTHDIYYFLDTHWPPRVFAVGLVAHLTYLPWWLGFGLVPWFVFEAMLVGPVVVYALQRLIAPVEQFFRPGWWPKFSGVLVYGMLAMPLAYDDDSWWDFIMYLCLVVPIVAVAGVLTRRAAGRGNPSQIGLLRHLLDVTRAFAPMIKIKEDARLASSIEAGESQIM